MNSISRDVIYNGDIHTDKFPYVPWSLVENLKPASSTAGMKESHPETYSQTNSIHYIQQVYDEAARPHRSKSTDAIQQYKSEESTYFRGDDPYDARGSL